MLTLFLAEAGIERLTSLRRAVCSGEELPVAAARDFLQRLPGCRLDNLYGPTESAIDVSYWQCTPDRLAGRDRVPIGAPIQNVELYVLDRAGHPVPRGIAGELYIGGVGLATGYLNRPELTAERFVDSPFGRLYRTGDLARWNRDGDDAELDYLGRIDFQVKLRGQRIELGEIEQVLRGQPGVSDAVVVVHDFGPSAAPDKRLVAYVTGAADDLRDALKAQLPDYMVPSSFTVLDEFPLSPNGKLDRAALPEPQSTRTTSTLVEPRTDIERVLAGIWCELIGLEQVGIEDDFFDLGGHSLLATQVVARLRPHLPGGKQVGVMDVFTHRTIRELAAMITSEEPQGPRQLLYRLTKPVATALVNYVCVPYGGGSAAAYQPVADALPAGHSLYALAIPGHDVGLDEVSLPFDELAHRCVAEVLERVDGPLVLYGHCGVGGALIIEVARQLEAAGRSLEAVYAGAIFPFAKPRGTFGRLAAALEKMESNRGHANWLRSHGVAMDELDPEQADRIISNMRHDSKSAEHFFTNLLDRQVTKLNAPVISVVGQRDPVTDYWQERYREWGFITDTTAVVVLEEAGHFFLKYRADELVEILTRTHPALGDGARELTQDARGEDARWWLHELHRADDPGPRPDGRQPATPSMRRYLTVASGQILSLFGTSLTRWAFPVWVYLQTGSVFSFGLMAGLMLLPGIVVAPFAGAIIDRVDRRQVLITASITAGSIELFLAGYLMLDYRPLWPVFALIMALSGALAFQRIGYQSAIPQLAPKRYLGHINGVDQMINGTAELAMPMLAAALVSVIDLQGILIVDICSYLFAVSILMAVRFPQVMGWRPREPLLTQIANGFRFSWRSKGFRSLLIYFSLTNLCIGPTIVAITPLVLSFSTVGRMGQVSLACALGIVVGGAIIATWGGPKRRRVLGVLAATVITALSAVLAGLHQSLPIIMAGGFGMELGLALENGIYQTMVQVKVPQRYHGRVFATNQLIAWSTLPISYALIAPYSISLANSMLGEHGVLAHNVGAVIGTGPGRGIGLTISFYGLVMLVIALVALRVRPIARFDDETPDALPDDLVGAQVVSERVGSASGPAPTERVLAEAGAS
jgi:surfactin synthase thioesterase subunit/MFS family permease